jgi:hypothetical protein
VIGIGFLSMLIGLVAQQFVQPQVRGLEGEVRDVGDVEVEVQAELRAMADRLLAIERRLSQ